MGYLLFQMLVDEMAFMQITKIATEALKRDPLPTVRELERLIVQSRHAEWVRKHSCACGCKLRDSGDRQSTSDACRLLRTAHSAHGHPKQSRVQALLASYILHAVRPSVSFCSAYACGIYCSNKFMIVLHDKVASVACRLKASTMVMLWQMVLIG